MNKRGEIFCVAALMGVLAQTPVVMAQDLDYGPLQSAPAPEHVGAIIDQVARVGRGDHYFVLTYCTSAPGVVLPLDIRSRHPVEITIVLQWQYENLERVDDKVRVTVFFGGQPAPIVIPLNAITHFSDPSVGLAVWLRPGDTSEERCADKPSIA